MDPGDPRRTFYKIPCFFPCTREFGAIGDLQRPSSLGPGAPVYKLCTRLSRNSRLKALRRMRGIASADGIHIPIACQPYWLYK
jgi:hypothetical protein